MISLKVPQHVSGTQAGLKPSLLVDLGLCTYPGSPCCLLPKFRSADTHGRPMLPLQGDTSLFLSILG